MPRVSAVHRRRRGTVHQPDAGGRPAAHDHTPHWAARLV